MRFGGFLLLAVAALLAAAPEASNFTFGPNGAFRLEISRDGFGDRSHGVLEVQDGHTKPYPLPQSTFQDYKMLRANDLVLNPFPEKSYKGQEVIGPHQLVGNRLWFGKSFFDGEGERGVGAFGYFDADSRQYQLFSPPELAKWEASAILVESDTVWVGLDHSGDDVNPSPGGILRWTVANEKVKVYPLDFVVTGIERQGKFLRLTMPGGYAEFRDGSVKKFR